MKILEEQADNHQKTRILSIPLEVGDGLAVEFDSLVFWFGIIAKGTLAENAALTMVKVQGKELIVKSMEAE
jgi:Zn finger protein HypA/HybF involved in hydrogenase expression